MEAFTSTSPATPTLVRSFSRCPPLAAFDMRNDREEEACRAFNAAVLKEIRQLSREGLRGVVLSSRWPLEVAEHNEVVAGNAAADGSDTEFRMSDWAVSLATTVQQLTSLGLKVVVVAPTPQMSYDIPSCLARRTADECDIDRYTVDAQRRPIMRVLRDLDSRWSSVTVFDPIGMLCDRTTCFVERAGRILFRDDDHLTATASRELLPAARASLRWATTPVDPRTIDPGARRAAISERVSRQARAQ
jgi:hypothetical protein